MKVTVNARITRVYKGHGSIYTGEQAFVCCKFSSASDECEFSYEKDVVKSYDLKEIGSLSITEIYSDLKEKIIDSIKIKIKDEKRQDSFDEFHNKVMESKNFTFDFEIDKY